MPVTDAAFDALKDRVVSVERAQAVKVATDEAVDARLEKMEASIIWLTRTVLGAIVLAGVAFVLKGGLNGIGV
jgi:hypothetical protein